MTALTAEMAAIQITTCQPSSLTQRQVERPVALVPGKAGTRGQPVSLISNYFPLELPESAVISQYDVKFTPQVESAGLARALLRSNDAQLTKGGNAWIFDGRAIMFTLNPLEGGNMIEFTTPDRQGTNFRVEIIFTKKIPTSTVGPAMMQVFNLLYRRSLRALKWQQIGRNHFDMNAAAKVPGFPLRVIPGILSTIYPSSNGLLYNMDVIFRTIHTDSVLDFIHRKSQLSSNYRAIVERELIGRIVMTNYSNRPFMVTSINWNMNPNSTFDRRSAAGKSKSITYAKYYKEQYDLTVRDMVQPLLCCHRFRQNTDEYFLPELCSMTGLTDEMRSDFQLMKKLKEMSILDPEPRLKRILQYSKKIITNPDVKKSLGEWKFSMNPKLLNITGRILPPPPISFAKRKIEFPDLERAGEWAIRSDPLLKIQPLGEWVVVGSNCNEVDRFIDVLVQVSKPIGLHIAPNFAAVADDRREEAFIDVLRQKVVPGRTQMVIVVLGTDNKQLYDRIKKYLCLEVPTPSQCVKFRTIRDERGLHSKATKLVVQAAVKIGSAPWTLDYTFPGPTMIIGIDVYHSGEIGSRQKSSIVGFTASMDAKITTFYSRAVKNPPGQELIRTIKPCVEAALLNFKKINNIWPQHIIVYRDGVGEGQESEVLNHELGGFREVLKERKIDAKIGFVIVLKRITTRLVFKTNNNEFRNPTPGTIVDTDIVHPGYMEFYLVSQRVTQGTATPTKYQVIFNEAGFSSDWIQLLTHQLCHSYFNWFGTIRVPAPCQYSHKLAFLVGQSLGKEDPENRLSDKLYYL